ncbi:hypothetical protein CFP56_034560 [Quercus suber]|uniref:Uncharacterized protein n=1 Tax=Quercus suber TaxID=58331 RepID=A0AAW0JBW1_QUESU
MNLDEHQSPREPLLLAEAFLPPYFCRRLKTRLIFKHQKSILRSVAPTATVAYDNKRASKLCLVAEKLGGDAIKCLANESMCSGSELLKPIVSRLQLLFPLSKLDPLT